MGGWRVYCLLMGQKVKYLTRKSHEIIWTDVWKVKMVQKFQQGGVLGRVPQASSERNGGKFIQS